MSSLIAIFFIALSCIGKYAFIFDDIDKKIKKNKKSPYVKE